MGAWPLPSRLLPRWRRPEIVADAAYRILVGDSRAATGNFFVDEEVLRSAGETDFDRYAMRPGVVPKTDIFLPD